MPEKKWFLRLKYFAKKKKEFNEKIPIPRDIPTPRHTANFFPLKPAIKHSAYVNTDT